MSGPVHRSVAAGVATITLAQPDNRNALSVGLVNALGSHLESAMGDDSVRAIVLTNEGPAFCAGADLKGAGATTETPLHDLVGILSLMLDGPKPVIGRIAGHCAGGGVGLAAACDISVAADDATLAFTEARIGVAPAIISVVCLPKLRRADANELFLRANRISARRAVEVGLLNHAVPRAELDAAVAAVVDDVVHGGPQALAACKRLLTQVPDSPRDEAFAWTGRLSAELFQSAEAVEGIAAFREKRRAAWVPGGEH